MSPFCTLTFFWLTLAFLTGILFYTRPAQPSVLQSRIVLFGAVTLLGLYVVSPLSGPSFFGLEYEDAFEYAYAGALLALAPG